MKIYIIRTDTNNGSTHALMNGRNPRTAISKLLLYTHEDEIKTITVEAEYRAETEARQELNLIKRQNNEED